jgi:Ca2+-binding RTX toxin-like protein
MRRTAMMLGLMAVFVVVAAGMAWAVTKTCGTDECTGTDNDDVLYEQVGRGEPDSIKGLAGRDFIDANTFNDDRDVVQGGTGPDKLLVNDGDRRDVVRGGSGRDVCVVDRGDGRRGCEVVRVRDTVGGRSTDGGTMDLPAEAF